MNVKMLSKLTDRIEDYTKVQQWGLATLVISPFMLGKWYGHKTTIMETYLASTLLAGCRVRYGLAKSYGGQP